MQLWDTTSLTPKNQLRGNDDMVSNKDVALVGMACVFPQAANLKRYWGNIVNAVDCIGDPTAGRWHDCSNFGLPAACTNWRMPALILSHVDRISR